MTSVLTRRATLAAGLGMVSASAAAGMRDRLGELRLGANIERWFPIASGGRARRLGRGWWEALRGAGFDHVRLFIPKDAGEGEEVPRLFLQAVQDAADAGLPVFLGLEDIYPHWEPWSEARWRSVEARARLFGRATAPAQLVLAPLNEPALRDAQEWTPIRDRMLAMLRAAAPWHTLMWGGHEWCSWRSLPLQTPPADPNTIAEVHDYQGGDGRAVAQRFREVAAWRERHRMRVIVSELGGALPHAEDEAAWAADLGRALPELWRLGMPATLWAITHGGHWRLQADESPVLRPRLAAALAAARQ